MKKVLGSGTSGTVRLGFMPANPDKDYAIKSIPRKKIDYDLQSLEQELLVMMELDHPNIIKFHEVYRDNRYYHIVMEYCEGVELFDHLHSLGKLNEGDTATIIKQILSAIKYIHDKNIAHRDIKPENILVQIHKSELTIKLIDFGFSKLCVKGSNHLITKLGTPYYISPEILHG